MRKLLNLSFVILAAVTFAACGNTNAKLSNQETAVAAEGSTDTEQAAAELGKVSFEDAVFDFGTIKEGAVVERIYAFKNEGKSPVILSQVSASCGCTTPSFTQTPVLPGKTGEIKVVFDSNGQVGKQQKIVTVVSNAENAVTTVQLKGEVLAK